MQDGKFFNKGNGGNTISGCAFGLVQDQLDANGNVQYNPEIKGPDLFGKSSAVGKTVIDGYSLEFSRTGDNYTLASVQKKNGEPVKGIGHKRGGDLSQFEKIFAASWKSIYSNNFWPMDQVYDGGAYGVWEGHDPKFGKSGNIFIGKYLDETGKAKLDAKMPTSDDSYPTTSYTPAEVYNSATDHNSYFGMRFELEFDLQPDYVGTLDYCFFGDDDMWVFLDGKQILDIGGVHSSVGEYVDLWDYIDKDGRTEVEAHKLSFFYLERGASGSTCWMRFTIPEARFEEGAQFKPERFSDLQLAKLAEGDGLDGSETFAFGIALKDKDGNRLMDDYSCLLHRPGEQDLKGYLTPKGFVFEFGKDAIPSVELKSGGSIEVLKVPVGSTYEITEDADPSYDVAFNGEGVVQLGNTANGTISAGTAVDVTCVNTYVASMELPKTGGVGTAGYYAIGATLAACAYLAIRRRRRELR